MEYIRQAVHHGIKCGLRAWQSWAMDFLLQRVGIRSRLRGHAGWTSERLRQAGLETS
ncbi:MAG: hypothetical protein K0S58_358 [Nitrospira sp.]|nr:hypothetical protein [Nitrospira sp.]